MRRGTQGHVAVPRGVHIYIFLFYIVYIRGIQPSVYRKVIHPLEPARYINPSIFFTFSRVGLSPTREKVKKIDRFINRADSKG